MWWCDDLGTNPNINALRLVLGQSSGRIADGCVGHKTKSFKRFCFYVYWFADGCYQMFISTSVSHTQEVGTRRNNVDLILRTILYNISRSEKRLSGPRWTKSTFRNGSSSHNAVRRRCREGVDHYNKSHNESRNPWARVGFEAIYVRLNDAESVLYLIVAVVAVIDRGRKVAFGIKLGCAWFLLTRNPYEPFLLAFSSM